MRIRDVNEYRKKEKITNQGGHQREHQQRDVYIPTSSFIEIKTCLKSDASALMIISSTFDSVVDMENTSTQQKEQWQSIEG